MLLVALVGGLAAMGWLPPFNRWVEQRLLTELRELGIESDATRLRELSWRRAVAGPVELQLPGLVLRVAEARAELGWQVLARRGSPVVVLRGLELRIDVDRLADLRAALRPQSGGFPYGRVEVEASRVIVGRGERRIELPLAGFIDSRVEEFRAGLDVDGPALAGRLLVRGDLGEETVELRLSDGRVAVESWRGILDGLVPQLAALQFEAAATVRLAGSVVLGEPAQRAVEIAAELPDCRWRHGEHGVELGAGSLKIAAEPGAPWRADFRPAFATWAAGDRRARLEQPVLDWAAGVLRWSVAAGTVAVADAALAGSARGTVTLGATDRPVSVEAIISLATAAVGGGWRLAAPAELQGRWNGTELAVAVPVLSVDGPCPVQLLGVDVTAGGWSEGHPRLIAKTEIALDADRSLKGAGFEGQLEPAVVAAKLAVVANLDTGSEGLRATVVLPQQRRTLVVGGRRGEAVVGGEAVVNLDRSFVSGSASLEFHDLIGRAEAWSVVAPEGRLAVRWPRVWLEGLARWGRAPLARLGRDLVWAGDYDGSFADAVVRQGNTFSAAGLSGKWRSRGAELHEVGGATWELAAKELQIEPGRRLVDCRVDGEFGLEGGAVRGECAVPDLGLRPTFAQKLGWSDGIILEGTFGIDPVVLSGKEAFGRWWPPLASAAMSGGISFSGRNRFAGGAWSAGGDLVLNDFNVRWSGDVAVVEGLRGRISFTELLPLNTVPRQSVAFRSLECGGVKSLDGEVTFGYATPGLLRIERWSSTTFGGLLETEGLSWDLEGGAVEARLGLKGAQLGELLALFDDVPATASGRVDGTLPVVWRHGRFELGTGSFRLSPGEIGRVEFKRDLQLISSGRRPSSPEYGALREVDRAIQTLVFDRLQIDLNPKDNAGQSMRVRLVGTPAGGEFAVPVTLNINVNAPLENLLNLGFGERPGGAGKR